MVLFFTVSIGSLDAQTVSRGDRVRVHFAHVEWVTEGAEFRPDTAEAFVEGSLVSWDSVGLVLQLRAVEEAAASDTFFNWADVDGLQQYAGEKSHMGTGALVGGLAGLAVGGLLAIASCPCEATTGQVIGVVGLVFVVPGALIGGLIGAAARSERWTPVRPGSGSLGTDPTGAAPIADRETPVEEPAAPEPPDRAYPEEARPAEVVESPGPAPLIRQPPAEATTESQLGVDFLYFTGMGSGPGVEASFAVTSGSGMRLGLGGELYFGGTMQSGAAQIDWSATGVFGEIGYRFSPTGWMPYVGFRTELLWARSETEWEGEPIVESWTELDLALGGVAGVEKRLSASFGVSLTGIAIISLDEGNKHRYGIRLGGRYLF